MKNLTTYLFCCLLLVPVYTRLDAAKIIVTSDQDSGPGTFRNAVASAAPGDTITFPAGGMYIQLTSGEIEIEKSLVILGPGPDKLYISGGLYRAFLIKTCNITVVMDGINVYYSRAYNSSYGRGAGGGIYNCANLTIRNSIVSRNYVSSDGITGIMGSGIYNSGTLYLVNSSIYANSAEGYYTSAYGGGLYNTGSVTILNSEISYNSVESYNAFHGGGGIENLGSMRIENSTIDNNGSFRAPISGVGGISNTGPASKLYILNSTISSNHADTQNGPCGINNEGSLTLSSCTVTLNAPFNTNYSGNGITSTGSLTIENSIVARNGNTPAYGVDGVISGTLNDLGYNLIGVREGFNLTNSTDLSGSIAGPLNPVLGPLTTKENGGTIPTHALLPGSPAIDAGNPQSTLTRDERGKARPFNGRIDIGAFEWYGPLPKLTITSPVSGATFTAPASITITAVTSLEGQPNYLRVSNPSGGFRKLKMGYDNVGIYHGSQNVLASGNNMLEITLRDSSAKTDWTKIQVRPNGVTSNPLSLARYVSSAGGIGNQFKTIRIPLSDFDPSIDFTQLKMFELPYSLNAPAFTINIQKIVFTGGSAPFLWFGDQKIDNAYDGTGAPGELVAALVPATGYVRYVTFYNGNVKIGEDSTKPYSITWKNVPAGNYQITARAALSTGLFVSSAPVSIKVVPAAVVFSEERMGIPGNTAIQVYPNPVQNMLTVAGSTEDLRLTLFDETGGKVCAQEVLQGEADFSFLTPGMYVLRLETKSGECVKTVKLLKR